MAVEAEAAEVAAVAEVPEKVVTERTNPEDKEDNKILPSAMMPSPLYERPKF